MADDDIVGSSIGSPRNRVVVPEVVRVMSLGDLVELEIDPSRIPSIVPQLPFDIIDYFRGRRISGYVTAMTDYCGNYWIGLDSSPSGGGKPDLVYVPGIDNFVIHTHSSYFSESDSD